MKGYLYTALTVLMFMSLFLVSYFFFLHSMADSAPTIWAEKTGYLFSDIEDDLSSVLGAKTTADVVDDAVYSIEVELPGPGNMSYRLDNYSAHIGGSFAREMAEELELDVSSLASSTSAISFELYPTDYSFGFGNLSMRSVWVANHSGASAPKEVNITVWAVGENIEDNMWLEAEGFSGSGFDEVADNDASDDAYLLDFTEMSSSAYVPFTANYTVWVRALVDDTWKNITVEVDGKNTSELDLRREGEFTAEWGWYNDTVVAFNLSEGDIDIKVHPGPDSTTESLDVVFLTTGYTSLDNSPPIGIAADPARITRSLAGSLGLNLLLAFDNRNLTYQTGAQADDAPSIWNLTLADGDTLSVVAGGVGVFGKAETGAMVDLDDEGNGSAALVNITVSFGSSGGEVGIGSGLVLMKGGTRPRNATLWLAHG